MCLSHRNRTTNEEEVELLIKEFIPEFLISNLESSVSSLLSIVIEKSLDISKR